MAVQLSGRLVVALTVQMNREMAAALVYRQMRCDFKLQSWDGFSKFMCKSEEEELGHANGFDHYLTERNVRAEYGTIQLPTIPVYSTPLEYFERALDLEKLYWVYIEELYALSEEEKDPDTCRFLYQYIQTQHESVDELVNITTQMRRAGMDVAALQHIDEKMAE